MTATQKRAATMARNHLSAAQIERVLKAQNRRSTPVAATPSAAARAAAEIRASKAVVAAVATPEHTKTVRAMTVAEQEARFVTMRGKNATIGQMKRINRSYKALGLREFTSLDAFRLVFTMETAAREYASLVA